jgi:hypothetical protein
MQMYSECDESIYGHTHTHKMNNFTSKMFFKKTKWNMKNSPNLEKKTSNLLFQDLIFFLKKT